MFDIKIKILFQYVVEIEIIYDSLVMGKFHSLKWVAKTFFAVAMNVIEIIEITFQP